ncbi:hypothetical protein [Brunnivagina elsteri]|nr:hypothetical protein [Calothrix elsteri]
MEKDLRTVQKSYVVYQLVNTFVCIKNRNCKYLVVSAIAIKNAWSNV